MVKSRNVPKLAVSVLLSFAAGAIGSVATFANISTWYAGLAKPAFNPPNWLFGPVWTALYALMGISLYLAWTAKCKGSKHQAFMLFGAQLVLNAAWSIVFFGLHSLWGGVVVILILLATIAVTIRKFLYISRPAAYLLTPYLLWVSFATILNAAVALGN